MTAYRQLPVAAEPELRHQPATDTVRLLAFNAQHASPGRARLQAAWIASQETADLVVLTEVGPGPGGRALIDAMTEHGYASVIALEPTSPDYRTVLASRGPYLTAVPSGIDILPHRSPAATVSLAGQTIGLLGIYVPSRGPRQRRNESKRAFQQAITRALPGFLAQFAGPVIIAGDLNVVEPGHTPHHLVFGAWEYDFYSSFCGAGLADAYRARHPHAIEHSWFGRSGQGYRFDHVFVSARHSRQVRSCAYLHTPRQEGLTDHAALSIILALITEDAAGPSRRGRAASRA